MQFKASLAAMVMCIPAITHVMAATISARAPAIDAYVFVCTAAFNGGTCENFPIYYNTCANFPSTYHNTISTAVPNPNLECTLFVGQGCTSSSLPLTFPGTADLTTYAGGVFNDKLNSILCTRS